MIKSPKDLEHRNLLQTKSQNLEKMMNEKKSKRRIRIIDLQKGRLKEMLFQKKLIKDHKDVRTLTYSTREC